MEVGAQPYDYRYTHYDPGTGAEGNPSPAMTDPINNGQDALRREIDVTPTAYGNANIRQRIYRRGGSMVTDWFFCGQKSSDGGQFADTLTDGLRSSLLRLEGYRVDVMQFVGSRHTPRNTLLRAVLTGPPSLGPARGEYDELVTAWGVTPRLAVLLGARLTTPERMFALHRRMEELLPTAQRAIVLVQAGVVALASGAVWGPAPAIVQPAQSLGRCQTPSGTASMSATYARFRSPIAWRIAARSIRSSHHASVGRGREDAG